MEEREFEIDDNAPGLESEPEVVQEAAAEVVLSLEDAIITYVLETPNNVNPAIIKAIFQKFNQSKQEESAKA